jgi:tRNA pseudouridine-54 N-methylase
MSGPVLEQLHKCLALDWSSYTNVWPCIGAVTQMSGPVLEQLHKCLTLYYCSNTGPDICVTAPIQGQTFV